MNKLEYFAIQADKHYREREAARTSRARWALAVLSALVLYEAMGLWLLG